MGRIKIDEQRGRERVHGRVQERGGGGEKHILHQGHLVIYYIMFLEYTSCFEQVNTHQGARSDGDLERGRK